MFRAGIAFLLFMTTPAVCMSHENEDIRAEFWAVLQETKDHLSQLDLELPSQLAYFESAAEHSRQGGSISFEEYSQHSTKAIQLLSCLDTYQAHPGTEKL